MPGGRPRKFKTAEELETLFFDYIDHCSDNKFMPNISGFCTYCKRVRGFNIHRDSYYEYAKKPEYSDTIKSINDAIEDAVLNCKVQKDLIKIAYLNNKCGYTTKVEQNISGSVEHVLLTAEQKQAELAKINQQIEAKLLEEKRRHLMEGSIDAEIIEGQE